MHYNCSWLADIEAQSHAAALTSEFQVGRLISGRPQDYKPVHCHVVHTHTGVLVGCSDLQSSR